MRRISSILYCSAVMVLSFGLFACADSETTCDEESFQPKCLSDKYLEICTHGEIAKQEASTCHICKGNSFIKDTSNQACK